MTYGYRFNDKFSLGVGLSYSTWDKEWTMPENGKMNEKVNIVSILPRFKANWLRAEYVTLYSTVAMGVSISNSKFDDEKHNDTRLLYSFQVSPIGIEVGKDIAGFAEVGFGDMGIGLVGLRAKF